MKNRAVQYILIILVLTAIAGSYFYFQSRAAMTVNKAGLTSIKINSSQAGMLTSGLVGHWTFDGQDTNWTSATAGTVTDRSGNSNAMILTNMNQSSSPAIGKVGQALYFDGVNDIAAGSADPGLYDNISFISVSLWFKLNQLSSVKGEEQYLAYKRHSSSPWSSWVMSIRNSDDKLHFDVINSSVTGVVETSNSAMETGKWYYAVGVYDGSNVTLYVNGVAATSPLSLTGTIYDSNNTLRIGASAATGFRTNGIIDEARVYNRALSASEITELYNQGQAKINASQANKLTSGLVGYWTFDGQDTNWTSATAGTTADKSPIGTNTGTLTNMSQSTTPAIGKVGQALNFDGVNDYVNAGDGSSLQITNGSDITISAWIKPNVASDYTIVDDACSITSFYSAGITGANRLSFKFENWECTIGGTIESTGLISLNQWQHIVFVRTNSQATFYINGTQDSGGWQDIINEGIEYGSSNPTIIGSNGYNGYMDEVRIYNRALSAAEITELYNLGR